MNLLAVPFPLMAHALQFVAAHLAMRRRWWRGSKSACLQLHHCLQAFLLPMPEVLAPYVHPESASDKSDNAGHIGRVDGASDSSGDASKQQEGSAAVAAALAVVAGTARQRLAPFPPEWGQRAVGDERAFLHDAASGAATVTHGLISVSDPPDAIARRRGSLGTTCVRRGERPPAAHQAGVDAGTLGGSGRHRAGDGAGDRAGESEHDACRAVRARRCARRETRTAAPSGNACRSPGRASAGFPLPLVAQVGPHRRVAMGGTRRRSETCARNRPVRGAARVGRCPTPQRRLTYHRSVPCRFSPSIDHFRLR